MLRPAGKLLCYAAAKPSLFTSMLTSTVLTMNQGLDDQCFDLLVSTYAMLLTQPVANTLPAFSTQHNIDYEPHSHSCALFSHTDMTHRAPPHDLCCSSRNL